MQPRTAGASIDCSGGGSSLKALRSLFGFTVLALAIYGGYKTLPVALHAYEFEDAVNEEAKLNAYTKRSEVEISQTLMLKAHNLDIPLKPEQLKVLRFNNELSIKADYSIPVDFAPYPFELSFHPEAKYTHYAGL